MAVVVDVLDFPPRSVGKFAQALLQFFPGVGDRTFHDRLDRLDTPLLHQFKNALASGVQSRDLPFDVQTHERIANLVHDPAQDVFPDPPRLYQLDRRHAQAFLVHVDGLDRKSARVHSARIELVARSTDPSHQFGAMIYRCHSGEIGMVDRTEIRIVADEDVAVTDAHGICAEPLRAVHDQRQDVALRHDIWTHGNQTLRRAS